MLKEVRPAIILLIALTLITGLLYPLAITGIAGVIFPNQAQGSLIERDGKVVGSALIGQVFSEDRYFQGRPSATVTPDPKDPAKNIDAPYNAANSGGSNLGPTNKALVERVKGDVDKLKAENPSTPVPTDLVTTTASGCIRISRPQRRCSRCRGLQRHGTCQKIASASSCRSTRKAACSDCWASRA